MSLSNDSVVLINARLDHVSEHSDRALEKLIALVESTARIEERQAVVLNQLADLNGSVGKHDEKIRNLEEFRVAHLLHCPLADQVAALDRRMDNKAIEIRVRSRRYRALRAAAMMLLGGVCAAVGKFLAGLFLAPKS